MEMSKLKSLKVCFNSSCKKALVEQPKKGWSLRSGGCAELCDLCGFAYEEGKFCETFHLNASGWRCCETCGKQIHCGCIVSFHMFVLLDAGGIGCLTCARKSFVSTRNPAWPLPSRVMSSHPERIKDLSLNNWSPIAGSGPVPWRQAPSLFSGHKKIEQANSSFEFDVPNCTDILHFSHKMSAFSFERQHNEDSIGQILSSEKTWGPDILENSFSAFKSEAQSSAFAIGSNCPVSIKDDTYGNINMSLVSVPKNNSAEIFAAKKSSNHNALDVSTDNQVHGGKANRDAWGRSQEEFKFVPPFKSEAQSNAFAIGSNCMVSTGDDTYGIINTASVSVPKNNSAKIFAAKKSSNHNELDVSTDNQVHGGKANGDAWGRSHVLARYSPHITDQELIKISGENHIITPLFEKRLSASDAGKIGRLVLPKKCAEAYLPSISHPEGLPLEVRDAKGNEWLLQFRFWPNNSSRMYVLEGVTPCIQSLQLQAGDIVTFSRLEPEGKLIMGGRKASATSSTYQVCSCSKNCTKRCETDSMSISKPEERVDIDVSNCTKRKSSTLDSRSKSLMIDNSSMVELKLTLKEAQGLIRPPPGNGPNVIVIEDCEIEEYEIAPIIGRPSIPSSEGIQWVQCDDCLKWRKVPVDTLLPSMWTCSANLWDKEKYDTFQSFHAFSKLLHGPSHNELGFGSPLFVYLFSLQVFVRHFYYCSGFRSMCSAAQELTAEHLADLLPAISKASFKKTRLCKAESASIETLEAPANLDTREEASLQTTTRHPRHKPGCSCIVCMQNPSGKGPKHKQSCDCIVCVSVKRRFRTLMTKRREKQQLEKDAEMTLQKLELDTDVDLLAEVHQRVVNHDDLNGNSAENEIYASPSNARVDLNSQPERVKELARGSDFSTMFHLIHQATEIHLEQQNQSCPTDKENSGGHASNQTGLISTMFTTCIPFDESHERIDMDHRSALPADILATTASTSQ